MKKNIIIPIIIILLVVIGLISWIILTSKNQQVACTLEAKICPDGTSVGRIGPNCEFAPCPSGASCKGGPCSESGIIGKVLLGPTCPVQKNPPDPQCADKPYATKFIVSSLDQKINQEFSSDKQGNFKISLPIGEYNIEPVAGNNILPRCSGQDNIKVLANQFTEVKLFCDTGIR